MNYSDPVVMHLKTGLSGDIVTKYSNLIAEITKQPIPARQQLPYLAPTLLFAGERAQSDLGMPVAGNGQILVQDVSDT